MPKAEFNYECGEYRESERRLPLIDSIKFEALEVLNIIFQRESPLYYNIHIILSISSQQALLSIIIC